jgi:hypothetical protein
MPNKNFELTADGYQKAKEWLTQTGQLHLLENEQSTDGYTLVTLANNLKTKMPITYKVTDITRIKIYAHAAMFFKQGSTGMMLRIDSCDENYFHCRDENSEVRRHEIIDIPYSSVDLDKDTFYKLAAINY